MTSTRQASVSTRTQRRRAEIVDAASALFAELGYHRVGIDDVAASVGITGGAIYKHFAGKQDLIAQAVGGALTHSERVVADATNLKDALRQLAEIAVEHRRDGVLLTREVRNVDGERALTLRKRIDGVRSGLARLIASERPELSSLDARILSDAVLALVCSTAHHKSALSLDKSIALLAAMAARVAHAAVPPAPAAPAAAPASWRRQAASIDRRDMLIDAAVELFGRKGYWSATMDEIGAAADIAGPSIYQHFDSKSDLLTAVFTRGNEGLRLGLSRALADGTDAANAMSLLVASYADFVLGHPEVNRLLINESLYLPELEQLSIRGMQHRYVAEWVSLLQEAHPGLDEPTARFMTHAVLSVINNRGRIEPGDGTRLHDVLPVICHDLLLNVDPD